MHVPNILGLEVIQAKKDAFKVLLHDRSLSNL